MTTNHLEKTLQKLSAAGAAQSVTVPLAPTQRMIDVGAGAGGVDLEQAATIYEAMIYAFILSKDH